MWKTLYQSVQGTSHQQSGKPCQDSCAARELVLDGETVLVLACSDGAGSAEHSQVGSQVACEALLAGVVSDIEARGALREIGREQALTWLADVHGTLTSHAGVLAVEPRQLACTLLFAVLGQSGTALGQIGDGAIVCARGDQYEVAFWPQTGEYVNTTNFITDLRYPGLFEFAWRDEPLDEVALLTDGLQMVGLNYGARAVHAPFFAPLFRALRQQPNADDLLGPMRTFLESPQLAERTDDDKTLILATRLAG